MVDISNKILCVDDQIEITQLLEQQLRGRYAVSFANGAAEALRQVRDEGPFAVMLVDYAMPEMNGVELLREVQQRAPETVSIMLTAFADVSVAVSAMHDASVFRFVRKPWDPDQLRGFLDEALERYRVAVDERHVAASLGKVNQRLYERVQELEAHNAALQRRIAAAPGVLYEATLSGEDVALAYVSPAIEAITGISPADCLAATDPLKMLAGDQRSAVIASFQSAPDGAPQTIENSLYHRDGSSTPVRNHFRKFSEAGRARIIGIWLPRESV